MPGWASSTRSLWPRALRSCDGEGGSCVLGVQTRSSSLSHRAGAKGLTLPACKHPPNSTDGSSAPLCSLKAGKQIKAMLQLMRFFAAERRKSTAQRLRRQRQCRWVLGDPASATCSAPLCSELSRDLLLQLRDSGWNNLGRIYGNHIGAKGGTCLGRAVAGGYSGIAAPRCLCPSSPGGIMLCREGIQHYMLQAYRSARRLPSSCLTHSSPAKMRSHLASWALVCLEKKLNGEMQIP